MSNQIPELHFPDEVDVVDLPSKGRFYKPEHPLYGQSAIEISHIRGKEEDLLTNIDYIRKGMALDKLVQSLIVNPDLKKGQYFQEILLADRNAIVVAARVTAYTYEYPIGLTCPSCSEKAEFEFDLRKHKIHPGFVSDYEGVSYDSARNLFKLTLPEAPIVIEVTPKNIKTEGKLTQKFAVKTKKDITNKDLYEDLVVSINGSSHPELVKIFFQQAPARSLLWFKGVIDNINPEFTLIQDFVCSECNHTEELEPPFTMDFLFPKRRKKKEIVADD